MIFIIVFCAHLCVFLPFIEFSLPNEPIIIDNNIVKVVSVGVVEKQNNRKIVKKQQIISNNLNKNAILSNKSSKKPKKAKKKQKNDEKYNFKHVAKVDYKIGTLNNPAPNYPRSAMRMNYQGVVYICADIDSSGNSIKAEICGSSGYDSLDNSALRTIKNWKFSVKSNGLKQIYYVKIPIKFSIN